MNVMISDSKTLKSAIDFDERVDWSYNEQTCDLYISITVKVANVSYDIPIGEYDPLCECRELVYEGNPPPLVFGVVTVTVGEVKGIYDLGSCLVIKGVLPNVNPRSRIAFHIDDLNKNGFNVVIRKYIGRRAYRFDILERKETI